MRQVQTPTFLEPTSAVWRGQSAGVWVGSVAATWPTLASYAHTGNPVILVSHARSLLIQMKAEKFDEWSIRDGHP